MLALGPHHQLVIIIYLLVYRAVSCDRRNCNEKYCQDLVFRMVQNLLFGRNLRRLRPGLTRKIEV